MISSASSPGSPGHRDELKPDTRLKHRIADHLDGLSSLKELDDARYHETHERFEGASNQRSLILDWLGALADRTTFPTERATRMLSAGCGGGVMDRRITRVIRDHVDSLSLVGVDPNPEHTEAFQRQFAKEGFEVEVFTGMFEDYDSQGSFDLIHFVHCLYYFEHIEPELRKAVDMLTPGGALIVLQAPNEALNHLADRVWRKQFDQSAWYSDDVMAVLSALAVDLETQRINAEVDVTPCFDPADPAGIDILDFIVQADTRQFSEAFQSSLRESLRQVCRAHDGRLMCKHPVDAIVARKSA